MLGYSISEFTEALASKTSVPGGGGAAALAGSIGIALGDMVGEFTVGKKKYVTVEPEIREMMEKAQNLRLQLLACIEKDAIAFEPLSKAYGIPKDDPQRDEIMEKCLWDAAQVPMEILRLCCQAIDVISVFAEKGSVIVLSDAACGAAICRGALQSAAVNVRINTRSMKNREAAEALNAEVEERLEVYSKKAEEIYLQVYSRY